MTMCVLFVFMSISQFYLLKGVFVCAYRFSAMCWWCMFVRAFLQRRSALRVVFVMVTDNDNNAKALHDFCSSKFILARHILSKPHAYKHTHEYTCTHWKRTNNNKRVSRNFCVVVFFRSLRFLFYPFCKLFRHRHFSFCLAKHKIYPANMQKIPKFRHPQRKNVTQRMSATESIYVW